MLKWFKKKTEKDADGASSSHNAEIIRKLVRYMISDGALAKKLEKYIETGDPVTALQDLKNHKFPKNFGQRLWRADQGKEDPTRELWKMFHPDPMQLVRLGEAAHALWEHIQFSYSPVNAQDAGEYWFVGLWRTLAVQSYGYHSNRSSKPNQGRLQLQDFLAGAKANEQDPEIIIRRLMMPEANLYSFHHLTDIFLRFPDLRPTLANWRSIVTEALTQQGTQERLYALEILTQNADNEVLELFVEELAFAATSGAKQVRQAVEASVRKIKEKVRPYMEGMVVEGTAATRTQAVTALARLFPEDAVLTQLFTDRMEQEKSSKVKEQMQLYVLGPGGVLSAGGDQGSGLSGGKTTAELEAEWQRYLPEPYVYTEPKPLSGESLEALKTALEKSDRDMQAWHESMKGNQWYRQNAPKPLLEQAERIFKAIQATGKAEVVIKNTNRFGRHGNELERFCTNQELTLEHVLRLGEAIQGDMWDGHGFLHKHENLVSFYLQTHDPVDLREVAAIYERMGKKSADVGRGYLRSNRYFSSPLYKTAPEPWKYFASDMVPVRQALGLEEPSGERGYYLSEDEIRQNAYAIFEDMPALPPEFVPYLWEAALGTSKKDRPLAQNALRSLEGKEARIIESLKGGKQEVRASAALWLAELNCSNAIAPLKEAVKKEKHEIAKGAMFEALERLGVPLDEFLDRAKLKKEAEKFLAKGPPKDVAWFSVESLPAVHWADSGEEVPLIIIHYFIGQAVKLKSPEAPVLIRKYCEFLNAEDRRNLGRFLLNAWLAEDTRPAFTASEAQAKARQETDQMKQYAQKNPNWYPDFDEQSFYHQAYNRLLNECLGSAIGSKGILGMCACCCTADISADVYTYVKKWFGHRMAQCKALLIMLGQIPERSCIQVLLSIGNRFRTKGIQEEAKRQAEFVAEREGWTMDELADRTIPTSGFDENGFQEVDYGPRQFAVTLRDDFSIEIKNPDGKVVKSLPNPSKSDDEELATANKKAFNAAKKELKEVQKMQKSRLYEALCIQRQWRYEDWDEYLNKHPIVGLYCQSLVWRVVSDPNDANATTFRPMPDRTLTDYKDEEVEILPDTPVALAHSSVVSQAIADGWLQHFEDYEVTPLFQQFGREQFELTDETRDKRKIDDYSGYMIDTFTLRSAALKAGFKRGPAEDAGMFSIYLKEFAAQRVRVILEFTGSYLPEENIKAALLSIYFDEMPPPGQNDEVNGYRYGMYASGSDNSMRLGEVPPVLLTEAWNDIKKIAAAGGGYDAEWKKKAEFA